MLAQLLAHRIGSCRRVLFKRVNLFAVLVENAFVDVINTGLLGLSRGLAGMQKAAQRVADPQTLAQGNLGEAVVDLHRYAHQFEASVRVIQRADDALSSLLRVGDPQDRGR